MKQLIPILLTAVVFCITGCQGRYWHEDMSVLDHIDSLFAHNDFQQAYDTVLAIESQMPGKSENTRMRFELQKIKAVDKLGKPLLTDSIILPIIDYYETEGDKRYLAEAYFYAGRTYASLNDAQRGLEYFNKALDVVGENDFYLLSRIHAQRGYLLNNQGLYDEAINAHKRSYDYTFAIGDTTGMINNYRDIGNCYFGKDDYKNAFYYYDKGEELAVIARDSSLVGLIGIDKTSAYTYQGEFELAEKYLSKTFNLVDSTDIDYANEVASYVYFKQRKYDLARMYYSKLLQSNSLYARQSGEAGLLSMAVNEKDLDEVIKHVAPFKELTDSLSFITDTEKIARINSLYNSQRLEKEKDRLERRNLQYTYLLILGGLLFLVFISMLAAYNYRVRAERNRLRHNNSMLDQFLKEEQLKRVATEQEIQQIQAERDRLANINMMEQLRMAQGDSKKQTILGSAVYEKLLNSEKAVTDKEMKDVEELINIVYPDFITRLHTLGVNKPQDMKVCLLLKMGFSPSHIASLLSRRESTLTNARKNLFKKITGKEGKAEEFDKIIKGI
ncbi:MAG: tetratricopeptide repeat protein [Bacteroidaceae bacterium]|nr:tetratricopeptide repeat protein [Bacteroidaceae bacterium]